MARDAVLLRRPRQLTKSSNWRYNHARHACSIKPRCPSCCKVEDGNRASADAPFWLTLTARLKAFTWSSADALWLKGVREGGRPVARRARSDSAAFTGLLVGDPSKPFKKMVTQNPDISCSWSGGRRSRGRDGGRDGAGRRGAAEEEEETRRPAVTGRDAATRAGRTIVSATHSRPTGRGADDTDGSECDATKILKLNITTATERAPTRGRPT